MHRAARRSSAARRRASRPRRQGPREALEGDDAASYELLVKWTDGATLNGRKTRGRGEVRIATLPFTIDVSGLRARDLDFLRAPRCIRRRSSQTRSPDTQRRRRALGFRGRAQSRRHRSDGPARRDAGRGRSPSSSHSSRALTDLRDRRREGSFRVAAPLAREIDLRPRRVTPNATSSNLGGGVAIVDVQGRRARAARSRRRGARFPRAREAGPRMKATLVVSAESRRTGPLADDETRSRSRARHARGVSQLPVRTATPRITRRRPPKRPR